MHRNAYSSLLEWKNKKTRKPLIIKGARQVGKTWLMKEFGRNEYKNVIYIDFENKKELKGLFEKDFDIPRILMALYIETNIKAEPGETLIIFDEIQEINRGITALKYFFDNAPEYHIMVAGSHLGISMLHNNSFPVGKVEFLELKPLNFIEFIKAMNQQGLAELILSKDRQLIHVFKSKLIDLLKQYFFVGGMPEAVQSFSIVQDFAEVRKIQKDILMAYEHDFAKHAPANIVPRIRQVWQSIPSQLAKENKKFIFSLIREGARAKEYELALEWLLDSGLIYKVKRISKPGIPLKSYMKNGAFKIFLLDTGLLGALSELDYKSIIKGNTIFKEFKGALTEQYVAQQIIKLNPFYWSAENSQGEIDFIVQYQGEIIPIEVKAEENLKSKSLKAFSGKYQIKHSVRISMSDYKKQELITNYPLYCLHDGFLEGLF